MTRMCLHLPRVMTSGRSLGSVRSVPVQVVPVSEKTPDKCQCCFCNDDLLKLQVLTYLHTYLHTYLFIYLLMVLIYLLTYGTYIYFLIYLLYPTYPYPTFPYLTLPYLSFPFLTLPFLTLPYLSLPYPTFPFLSLPYLSFPYLALPFLTLPYLSLPCPTFPYLALPCPTFPYLALPFFTLPYLSLPYLFLIGARCSSMARAFAHGVMGRWIDPSWGGPIELFLVSASVPRQRLWYMLSCLWDFAYKRTLAVNQKEKPMWRQQVSSLAMVLYHMSDAI